MKFFGSIPLFNEAGEAGGGGGAGTSAPGSVPPPAAPAPAAVAQPANAGDAPVTRSEFDALMAKLDKLAAPPAAPPPKTPEAPRTEADQLADLTAKVTALLGQTQQQQNIQRKQQLVDAALAGVPEQNRGLAQLALDGLLASTGVKLDGADINIGALAEQLGGQLRTQFGASLFNVPGSQFKAVPKAANGGFDWTGVRSLAEVPPEMFKHIPDDVYRRLRAGGGSSAVLGDGAIIPGSRYH